MKRIFITLLFIFAVTLSANAQVRLTENFAYTAGDSIGAHGWNGIYNGGFIPMMVTAPGLTYTGYPLSGIGNACTVNRVGSDYYKDFTPDSSGSTYCSFMLRVDSSTTTGDYFFALLASTSTTNFTSRLTIKDTLTNQFRFGLSKGTVASGAGWSGAYNKGTVYVVVVKYTFNPVALDDLTSLYVFETGFPATEPVVPTILPVVSTSGDAPNIGRIALRAASTASSPKVIIDGIRVAKSWPDLVTGIITTTSTVADKFSLSQNYPNPFNPSTTIKFSLPSNGMTSLKVYDLMGKEVSSLVNGNMNAGEFTTQFNGANLSSGMYFYKLEFNGVDGKSFSEQKKLMLVK